MSKLTTQIKEIGNNPSNPLPSFPSPSIRTNSLSSSSKISPILILIIVILAAVFFLAGILHLLIRYIMKRPSLDSLSISRNPINSNNNNNSNSNSDSLQRQLHQLFRLHDSGLDQALIDALPVFYYKDIMGIKEPFDCAVCLCEFCDQDKLRLLPLCSHAFHITCIDTWLLSNSTCPLCRGSLLESGLENQEFSLDYWRELSFGRSIDCENSFQIGSSNNNNNNNKPTLMEESASERRVFSVRLGKFRSLCGGGGVDGGEFENGETSGGDGGGSGGGGGGCSGGQLDGRRCYSLGSYQYVVVETNLQVALLTNFDDTKIEKMNGEIEGKKISRRNRRESFSVSKIWLWSDKGKFQGTNSLQTNVHGNAGPPPLNVVLPLSTRDHCP